MAWLTQTEAAEAAGVDRTTLYRKVRKGVLSCSQDVNGNPRYDTAELLRVFGKLHAPGEVAGSVARDVATQQPDVAPGAAQDGGLVELVAELRDRLAEAKEREEAAFAREARLMGIIEAQQAQLALPPAPPAPQKRPGFLARVFGRG